jgi:hypothetical protein
MEIGTIPDLMRISSSERYPIYVNWRFSIMNGSSQ